MFRRNEPKQSNEFIWIVSQWGRIHLGHFPKKKGNKEMTNQELKEELKNFQENTSLEQLQIYIKQMRMARGFDKQTAKDTMLFLTEEVGELAKEVRKISGYQLDSAKSQERDIEGEIADVFIVLLSLCDAVDVDLLKVFKEKEQKNCDRKWE